MTAPRKLPRCLGCRASPTAEEARRMRERAELLRPIRIRYLCGICSWPRPSVREYTFRAPS